VHTGRTVSMIFTVSFVVIGEKISNWIVALFLITVPDDRFGFGWIERRTLSVP